MTSDIHWGHTSGLLGGPVLGRWQYMSVFQLISLEVCEALLTVSGGCAIGALFAALLYKVKSFVHNHWFSFVYYKSFIFLFVYRICSISFHLQNSNFRFSENTKLSWTLFKAWKLQKKLQHRVLIVIIIILLLWDSAQWGKSINYSMGRLNHLEFWDIIDIAMTGYSSCMICQLNNYSFLYWLKNACSLY